MKKKIIYFFLLFLLQISCTSKKQEQETPDFPPPEVFDAKPYAVPQDKMAPPEITPAIETVSKVVSKPKVTTLASNVFRVGKPKVVIARAPKICVPGENGYSLPDTVPAVDSTVPAGLPEEILVKDIQVKDNNSASFTPLNTLNGLKSNIVFPIINDRAGHIWAGCLEGGLSKYDGRSITNYTSAQGLSDETFASLLEDSKGNLWIGYWGRGLDRFDGRYITHYTTKQGLSDNNVNSMLEDSKGNLWFGTSEGGVSRYDGKTFIHYNTEQGFAHKTVHCIIEDSKGNLWFGTGSGVSKFDTKSFSNYGAEQGLSNSNITGIVEDNNGDIWFCGHSDGIYKYDGQFFEHFSIGQGLPTDKLKDIVKDRQGNLWMTSDGGGIVKYDGNSFKQYTMEHGLSSNYVSRLLQDKCGIFWISTSGGGICRFDGEAFTHFVQGQGISQGNFHSVMEDKEGTIWASLFVGALNKYDGKTVTEYSVDQGLVGNRVACSLKDRKGNLWIGSVQEGGLNKYDGKIFTEFKYFQRYPGVSFILEDRIGNIWFGTARGLDKYDGKNFTHFGIAQGLTQGLKRETINCIAEDKNGNLWLGTDEGVVIKFDLSMAGSGQYSFTNYKIAPGTSQCFIYSVRSDQENNLWFSTTNAGAVKFDWKFFSRYTTAQGLSNISVNSIVKDKDGNMWFLTKNGLCKMLPPQISLKDKMNPRYSRTSLFTNYLFADGFFGAGSQFNTMTVDHSGNIWAGVSGRITVYHPEGDLPDTIPPQIEITGVSLFNEKMNWLDVQKKKDTPIVIGNGVRLHNIRFKELGKWYYIPQKLKLPYNNNHITFQFLGITTRKREQVKYKYMLEGFDDKWSPLTSRTEAAYTNLPHGKFTFKVKAANSEGYWSDELNYSFRIFPPWWKTWWAYSLFGITAFLVTYGLIRWRLQQKFQVQLARSEKDREVAELEQQKAEMEMQALRAQMNPHFIFNSLNSINRFILQNNRAQASEYLTKFSKLVRMILQNSQASLISLESELESLNLYLDLEAVRFEHRFSYKISYPRDLDIEVLKVPPLVIQPFTENAIWHGLMHKEDKGQLDIDVSEEDDYLYIKVTDNGIGRKKAGEIASKSATKHKSMGLRITKDRIAMLQKSNGGESPVKIIDLENEDGSAAGTEVVLKMPIVYD